jgi:hypothetical protein
MHTRIAGALLLGLSLTGPVGVWAQDVQLQQASPPAIRSQSPTRPSPDELGVSLDRIKFALGQAQPPQLKLELEQPTFRIQIIEKHKPWLLPEFSESLRTPWAPVPSGGLTYYEFMKMVTLPQLQPYGAFSSGELALVAATTIVTSLIIYGLQHGVRDMRETSRERQIAEIREQVRKELEDFLRANPDAPKPTWWTATIK